MTVKDWKAKSWLGLLTAGMLWIEFRDPKNINISVDSLAKKLIIKAGTPNFRLLFVITIILLLVITLCTSIVFFNR